MTKQITQNDKIKTFPEFSALCADYRDEFESATREFPPLADLSYAAIMSHWNTLDGAAVSRLNGNLVISYWLPGHEKLSGLSIVGKYKLDESICEIFDHQRNQGEKPRLVNVPEQIITQLRYPELFAFKEQRSHHEYILDLKKLYPLAGVVNHRRWSVNRFLNNIGEDNVSIRSIDLTQESNQQLMLQKTEELKQSRGALNKTYAFEQEALHNAILYPERSNFENVCLFVNGELQAYCLYDLPEDPDYAIVCHARISYELPHAFNYSVYAFGKWFADMGIKYLNLESDLGYFDMRMFKTILGPSNFFRKYTIEPAD
jgi:hypothetical protein